MNWMKALRDQFLKRLLHDLLARPAKHFFGSLVKKDTLLLLIQRNDGVNDRVQHLRQDQGIDGLMGRVVFNRHG